MSLFSTTVLRCLIDGKAVPQGSMNAGVTKSGRPFVYPANKNLKPWREHVSQCVKNAEINPSPNGDYVAYSLRLTFYYVRPQSHYGSSGGAPYLKVTSPLYHAKKPDLDKLIRAICDGLTDSGAIPDDSMIWSITAQKQFCDPDQGDHVLVELFGSYDDGE